MTPGQPEYRGIAPLTESGSQMSAPEYEQWRDAHGWYPSRESKLVLESGLAPAAWLEPLLFAGSFEVRMTAPQGFEAYARIFSPSRGNASSWTVSPAMSTSPGPRWPGATGGSHMP